MTNNNPANRLGDKYLPDADVSSIESVIINAPPDIVFPLIQNLKFRNSKVIYWLFKLRGMPVPETMSLQGLEKLDFVKLEETPRRGLIVGIIGRFWTPSGGLIKFEPGEFSQFMNPDYAKGTWSFELFGKEQNKTLLTTETRVYCPTYKTKRNFKRYWTFIRPFSTLIRKEILKSVKRDAEDAYHKSFV